MLNALRSAARAVQRAASSGAAGAAFAAGRASCAALSAKAAQGGPREGSAVALALSISAAASCSVAFASSSQERSFIMVKPDGVNRGLVGEIIKRFERKGYKVVGLKVLVPSRELAALHYAEHDGRPFFPKLVDFLSSGAVVAMVFEGSGAVSFGRTMIGATAPLSSAPGTIRGDFGIATGRNIIHGSDSVDSAHREIALWFTSEELADYSRVIDSWWVFSDASMHCRAVHAGQTRGFDSWV